MSRARERASAGPPCTEPVGGAGGHRWVPFGVWAVLVAPLVVALVALRHPRWYPVLELAQTEIHVRDVGTGRTPRTGLVGRIGADGERGSHPGPLSFFALAPAYRLGGATAWALQLATVVLHVVGLGVALWIAQRRDGLRGVLLVAAALAVLLRFYGADVLTQPWNPYLPLIWWVVFLLSIWSVSDDDLALLPVAVVSGSLCVQTHISYAGLVGALLAGVVATSGVLALRRRRSPPDAAPWHRHLAWLGIATALGTALWIPPVLDELGEGRGNLSVIVDYFSTAPEPPVGLEAGAQLVVGNLEPWHLLAGGSDAKVVRELEWSVGGLVLLGGWVASVAVAWRLRQRSLLRLHAVVGAAVVLAAVALGRIHGPPWAWLALWVWGLTALMGLAVAWTVGCWVRARWDGGRARPLGVVALAAVTVISSVSLAVQAVDLEADDPGGSEVLAGLIPDTIAAIEQGSSAGGGPAGRYLIAATDFLSTVASWGVANELDRAGITVGFEPASRLRAAPRLTMDSGEATAVLTVVTGPAIEAWDRRPGAQRVATFDPRDPEARATQEHLLDDIRQTLRAVGSADLIPSLEADVLAFQFGGDPRVPEVVRPKVSEVLSIGLATAIFLEAPTEEELAVPSG